jgi:hypothetical protein
MIKLSSSLLFSLLLFFCLLPAQKTFAQQGFYLQPFFMYQYVTLANNKDHYTSAGSIPRRDFDYVNTYKPAYGFRAIYNFKNAVGFETGLKYSNQGQKYKGNIIVDGNTGDTVNKDFTSELMLSYIQLPLMLNFNSIMANINDEADPVYMSIAMGIQFDFLQIADIYVNPGIDWTKYPNAQSQLKNFFSSVNYSFAGNISVNWRLKHGWQINASLFGSKTLNDIENVDMKDKYYNFDETQFPLEYQYPVSVKKEAEETDQRYKTTNIVYGLMLGVSYRLIHK